ncbi:hypothetical protein D1646_02155, partial [Pseudoflavonifractor sp. 60]|nr:hypothetical protein [Pseudoflavonifractor sp. 60]
SSLVPPAGGLAPLKKGSAKRWGLICWHFFYLESKIEAVVLRQSPALASLRHPLSKGGKRLRRLWALLRRAHSSSRPQAAWPLCQRGLAADAAFSGFAAEKWRPLRFPAKYVSLIGK